MIESLAYIVYISLEFGRAVRTTYIIGNALISLVPVLGALSEATS